MKRLLAVFLLLWASAATAQGSTPVRLVHGFAAGGNADVVARVLADALGPIINATVIVDARPGASGTIAAEQVARSAPDGRTLILSPSGYAFERALNPKLDSGPVKELTMVSSAMSFPFLVFVRSDSPHKTLADVLVTAREKVDRVSFATAGVGSAQHLTGELLAQRAGAKMLHVPYKGGAAAIAGLLGGEVDFMIGTATVVLPQLKAGKLRVLAVTTRQRWDGLPLVPTLHEAGVPDIDIGAWFGVAVPAGTPAPVMQRLNADISRALQLAAVRSKLEEIGGVVAASTPEQAQARVAAELRTWQEVVHKLPPGMLNNP